ncbi:MAG: type IA DNA topoisomerase [Lachnospiraceae bacterium]|nr:type IA DNA topoisomerase [Lachnospiraceae bacterium]
MSKKLFIAEKPSVAQEFAKALKQNFSRKDGYQESNESVVTWCVGHLVTMSYPEAYDPALKKWAVETLPFLPKEYKYELIPAVEKQFKIVKGLLNREDVDCIYICTDSGREGEYIYRLVDQMAKVPANKERRRVWIDSQTEEEILRGIREAKIWTEYDNLSDSAYLRAKEDYLMGINFSRILTLKYGYPVRNFMKSDKNIPISVGRVMTCVLGMVVRREREIRAFVKTPFYRVLASVQAGDSDKTFDAEFRAVEGSKYFNTPMMYKENGFKKEEDAKVLIDSLQGQPARVHKVERKKENKNAPLLFNLAELQNECSKLFKISPDETLKITQELYEKKLVTYPRTDARVLSTAVAKEIYKNIAGLKNFGPVGAFASEIMENKSYQGLAKTRYVNDKQITDHYAIIPTGQGLSALNSVSAVAGKVYQLICRRFLSIFYPPAVYQKLAIELLIGEEHFFANFKVLLDEGYYKVAGNPGKKRQEAKDAGGTPNAPEDGEDSDKEGKKAKDSGEEELEFGEDMLALFQNLKSGMELPVKEFNIKEGETSPPKRYNSGSLILAMENAGQLIEDEELRAQIKGSGIGTSATRAEILNKLIKITYLNLNKKTQIITPTLLGEVIYDVVACSIKSLLNAELTASWEKGLTYVAEGSITSEEYMQKLEGFVSRMTNGVKELNNQNSIVGLFMESAKNYK